MNIALPFLSDNVGLKYISHILRFTLAHSSIISKSKDSPTRESGLSADLPSNTDPHSNSIYCSLNEALVVAIPFSTTILCHISLNIFSERSYVGATTHTLVFGLANIIDASIEALKDLPHLLPQTATINLASLFLGKCSLC